MELQWWIWLVLGFGLILLELVLPTFFIIWFGIGAIAVGIIAGLVPGLSLASELVIWVVLSSLTVALWFKVFKPRKDEGRWTADAVIGEVGLLVAPVSEFQKGRVRFQKPVLGNEEWVCVANGDIASGERVRILAIEGNVVRVGKA